MTISLPGGHHVEITTSAHEGPPDEVRLGMGVGMACSTTWLRLDDGPWTRSSIASLHKLTALWLDATDIPGAWFASTGERLAWHVCEGCGVRDSRVRIVDGSDEWWCPSCR